MDIHQVKETIKAFSTRTILMIKGTMKLPYAKFYLLLSIALTILFIIFTFPYDVIIRNQIKKLEPAFGNGIYVGIIDFSLLTDSYIDELEISLRGGGIVSLREINFNIAMNPVTTLIGKTLKGDFTIHKFSYSDGETVFSGLINSEFNIAFNTQNGLPANGFLKLNVKDVSLKGFNVKGFDIPAVQFSAIKADTTLSANELKINAVQFEGSDLRGTIRGAIALARLMGNSTLNLSIELDPQSRIFENYKILLGNINKTGDNRLTIPVSGTLQDPKAEFPWNSRE